MLNGASGGGVLRVVGFDYRSPSPVAPFLRMSCDRVRGWYVFKPFQRPLSSSM